MFSWRLVVAVTFEEVARLAGFGFRGMKLLVARAATGWPDFFWFQHCCREFGGERQSMTGLQAWLRRRTGGEAGLHQWFSEFDGRSRVGGGVLPAVCWPLP